MYQFIETHETQPDSLSGRAMTYNGVLLDEVVEGFEVLNVYGRETTSVEIESVGVDIGSIPTYQRLVASPITVEYRLSAKDDSSFWKAYRSLMKILIKGEDVPFSFADEDAVYFGRYSSHESIENTNNDVVTSFDLYRPRPYKYSEEYETDGTLPEGEELDLFRMEIRPNTTTSSMSITNGEQTIRFVDSVTTGDVIVLDFKTGKADEAVTKNGVNFSYALAIDSDYENFDLNSGGDVTSPDADVTMYSRERWL